ncbi:hypothetical protein [Natrarchaeobius chitinivorans]|uniref:DUF4282 domain-containing protein n=1 Tax=Natrarchaeobius chitinivorans TaxID=1679083 RepID=A0A3N6LR94_NATCH|nr:hypothetical protein [Natrarchaeobius chitinivorans]RQG92228.1 hypothetical protein EA473_17090 [Natrarchaeobius chitinivorans]
MGFESPRSKPIGLAQFVLGALVVVISAYAIVTSYPLLGALAVAIVLLGYFLIQLLIEFVRLFRRMVVALERIAENS